MRKVGGYRGCRDVSGGRVLAHAGLHKLCAASLGALDVTANFWSNRNSAIAASAVLVLSATADARDASQVREFRKLNPCPATQQARGPCPGWVVDHIIPLCLGGSDAPHNMQWQTTKDAKAKDREERAQCREVRR